MASCLTESLSSRECSKWEGTTRGRVCYDMVEKLLQQLRRQAYTSIKRHTKLFPDNRSIDAP